MGDQEFELVVGEDTDLRNIIDKQEERFRHIQTLAQGFLASSLTILAVIATGFTAFGSPVPTISSPNPSQTPKYTGEIATTIIIGFSNILWLLLASWASLMFVISIWKCTGLILERPLASERGLRNKIILESRNKRTTLSGINDISSLYQDLIKRNRKDLEILRKRFHFAGFRLPGSLLLSVGALELYLFTVRHEITSIVAICLLFSLPSLNRVLLNRITDPVEINEGEIAGREITLFEELKLDDEHELSRWGEIEQFWWEKILAIFMSAISTIIVISFLLSYFV